MNITIDTTRCIGCGMCAYTAPNVFRIVGKYSTVLALPEKYREVVMLHYYQGLSSPETARILRVPQATVLTRLHRARKLLESELKGWYLGHE
jgi:Fe-S-cluster-containing hydrogenase component 2